MLRIICFAEPRFAMLVTIIQVADRMRESWVLSGWQAESKEEADKLAR